MVVRVVVVVVTLFAHKHTHHDKASKVKQTNDESGNANPLHVLGNPILDPKREDLVIEAIRIARKLCLANLRSAIFW